MADRDLPTVESLVKDLRTVARNGLGRSLPRQRGPEAIPHLSAAASALADNTSEDFRLLVAKLVTTAVRKVKPGSNQAAIAEILWIDFDKDDGWKDGEGQNKKAPPLTGHGNRYARAAEHLGATTFDVENNLSGPLLGDVARLIQSMLEQAQNKMTAAPVPSPSTADQSKTGRIGRNLERQPLATTVGASLMALGLAWLLATLAGLFS
jgi:hypothetical protein